MPTPSKNTTFRPELGMLAYAYVLAASQRGFIGLKCFPLFEVPLQAAVYPVIPAEAFLKLYETKRAARSAYGRSDWEFEDGDYFCRENGWEEAIDDSERKMYQRFFDAETIATMRAMDIILRKQEQRISIKCNDTSKLAHRSVAAKVTDPDGSFRTEVKDTRKLMRDTIGLEPNILNISWDTFQDLIVSKELAEHMKYTQAYLTAPLDAQISILSQYLGIAQLNIGNAIYDSAKKGQKLAPANIWPDDKASLMVGPSNSMDLKEPTLGRTFLWTDDSPQNLTTESYRDETKRSDIIRVRQNTDEAYVFEAAGYVLTGLR